MAQIVTYKQLIVWQKAMELVLEVYGLTEKFPKSEIYGLTSQIRRSAVSIPSNIAEGRRRGSRKSFHCFLLIAFGSGAELETQIEIARNLPKTKDLDYSKPDQLLDEVMRILNKMINNLRS
ncbi:MAG: four helix bundle protein [Patescibacteria group bacterium]|jgi:four helix bundle protein